MGSVGRIPCGMGTGNHSQAKQLSELEGIDFVVFELCLTDVFDVQGVRHHEMGTMRWGQTNYQKSAWHGKSFG